MAPGGHLRLAQGVRVTAEFDIARACEAQRQLLSAFERCTEIEFLLLTHTRAMCSTGCGSGDGNLLPPTSAVGRARENGQHS